VKPRLLETYFPWWLLVPLERKLSLRNSSSPNFLCWLRSLSTIIKVLDCPGRICRLRTIHTERRRGRYPDAISDQKDTQCSTETLKTCVQETQYDDPHLHSFGRCVEHTRWETVSNSSSSFATLLTTSKIYGDEDVPVHRRGFSKIAVFVFLCRARIAENQFSKPRETGAQGGSPKSRFNASALKVDQLESLYAGRFKNFAISINICWPGAGGTIYSIASWEM